MRVGILATSMHVRPPEIIAHRLVSLFFVCLRYVEESWLLRLEEA